MQIPHNLWTSVAYCHIIAPLPHSHRQEWPRIPGWYCATGPSDSSNTGYIAVAVATYMTFIHSVALHLADHT